MQGNLRIILKYGQITTTGLCPVSYVLFEAHCDADVIVGGSLCLDFSGLFVLKGSCQTTSVNLIIQ